MFRSLLCFLLGHAWEEYGQPRWLPPDATHTYTRLEAFHKCHRKNCPGFRGMVVSPDPAHSGVSCPTEGEYLQEKV